MTEAVKLEPGLQLLPLDQLHESEDNPREISDEAFDRLCYSLDHDPQMMKARPMIAEPDGNIVCGNMRHRALVSLGKSEGWVFVEDFTDNPGRRREWMLRDNQEYGDWVPEELSAMVAAHAEEDGDLKLLGFSEAKTDNLIKLAAGEESGGGGGSEESHETPAELFAVVVECESEEQQAQLIEELTERGLDVRALLS